MSSNRHTLTLGVYVHVLFRFGKLFKIQNQISDA